MVKITIQHTYNTTFEGKVELPEGKNVEDIAECSVKWGNFNCLFKDGSELEVDIVGDGNEPDLKRPTCVAVYKMNDNGEADYANDYANELGFD